MALSNSHVSFSRDGMGVPCETVIVIQYEILLMSVQIIDVYINLIFICITSSYMCYVYTLCKVRH